MESPGNLVRFPGTSGHSSHNKGGVKWLYFKVQPVGATARFQPISYISNTTMGVYIHMYFVCGRGCMAVLKFGPLLPNNV